MGCTTDIELYFLLNANDASSHWEGGTFDLRILWTANPDTINDCITGIVHPTTYSCTDIHPSTRKIMNQIVIHSCSLPQKLF